MKHVVFDHASKRLRIIDCGKVRLDIPALGDALGNYAQDAPSTFVHGYGPGCRLAPGHYRIARIVENPPRSTLGIYSILIADISLKETQHLIEAEKAYGSPERLVITKIALPTLRLTTYGREGSAIYGGSENPYHSRYRYQELTRTDGGIRVHNADLEKVVDNLAPTLRSQLFIAFSVVADPALEGA